MPVYHFIIVLTLVTFQCITSHCYEPMANGNQTLLTERQTVNVWPHKEGHDGYQLCLLTGESNMSAFLIIR